jgi:assimilatory nitrate reductase catalytic subunit
VAAEATKTTCPYCGVGCGLEVRAEPGGPVTVRGDPDHPANRGRLCSKGAALAETLGDEGRLLYPEIAGRRASWEEAVDAVAGGFREVVDRHGPAAVAFYVSGQLLTEDYYVANKLMKGFIGSGNIDTNSRLCMSSAVAGQRRAFGADTVPGCYEDLELADLVVLVGSNAAWCHPVLFQRIRAARQARPGMRVVVVDPRRTQTCEIADLHLSLRPGADVALFNGLLRHLDRAGRLDWRFLVNHAEGFGEALETAHREAGDPAALARRCGVPLQDLERFYRLFADTDRVVTLYSQGVNQWTCGTDKVNAIINCHLATGRIGLPGAGPFSLTGQPNAMGGREVGGLANQLAAHMGFEPESVARVGGFWKAPRMARAPGLKAVDLFRALDEGRIRALWVMATNPAVTLPDADRVRRALAGCGLLVVSDCVRRTETADLADVLLPAAGWGEKDGTVTNSERRISRQRAFREPPGEARPDWWIVSRVAQRMGFGEAFEYGSPAAIFREHAALSGLDNTGRRDFDISALADLDDGAYARLRPVQWPVRGTGQAGVARMFSDRRFFHAEGKARLVPVTGTPPARDPAGPFPLVLNTGRVRDQWHTMTRTGGVPRLAAHRPEPFVQVHPEDAGACRLLEGGLARIESRWGWMLARVHTDPGQRPGSVFVPMHWSDQSARRARVDALVNPVVDPISGQPELKHTPVRVDAYVPAWEAVVLTRGSIDPGDAVYAVRVPGEGFWRYHLAGEEAPDWSDRARGLLAPSPRGDWLEFRDPGAGRYRAAYLLDGRLHACLYLSERGTLPDLAWVGALFARTPLGAVDRAGLLAGRPPGGRRCQGRAVCACFNVDAGRIRAAIETQGLDSVEALGRALQAGTNCGSCIPELEAMLSDAARDPAA